MVQETSRKIRVKRNINHGLYQERREMWVEESEIQEGDFIIE